MSSPPRTLPDPALAEPPSPSRDEPMPQQSPELSHTPVKAAKSPEPKKSRQADTMKLRSRPEPSANPQSDSDEDESHNTPRQPATQATQMKVVKDWKRRGLVAFDDLGAQVAALAGVPQQSASRQSVLYGENFAWDNTLELLFLYPVLWNSAHSEFIVTKYFKKGGDDVTAATEAVADACRPAFLKLIETTPGKITIAVTLGAGQKRTGGPVADLAKALADMRHILRRNRRRTRLRLDRRASSSIASVTFDTTQS